VNGRTIALYGDTGAGKTTLAGEYAKYRYKLDQKRTLYFAADIGGFRSILPLVRRGIVIPVEIGYEDDPWVWTNRAADGQAPEGVSRDEIGVAIFDSGTSIGEALLDRIKKSEFKIGTQNTQKFTVNGGNTRLTVAANNEAHYGIVQGFMLDMMWKSTWLTRKGWDVIWTFSVHRGENAESEPIIGPKVAGKALTAALPKWFEYTFRVASVPQAGGPPKHVLYLQEQPGENGLFTSFGNSRCPIDASTPLPATLEPASLVGALELIENGQKEADAALEAELAGG